MASILLSGCGGGLKSRSQTSQQPAAAFRQENAKRFALANEDTAQLPLSAAAGISLSSEVVQAKLADIAVPFSTNIVFAYQAHSHNQSKGICAGFETTLTTQSISSFYEREMELMGWTKRASFESYESVFVFEKPNKTCVITMRSHPKKNNFIKSYISIFCS